MQYAASYQHCAPADPVPSVRDIAEDHIGHLLDAIDVEVTQYLADFLGANWRERILAKRMDEIARGDA